MAAMPIYGKNMKNSSSLEPKGFLRNHLFDVESFHENFGHGVLDKSNQQSVTIYISARVGQGTFLQI